uniref:Uncharacterized protein n=1 Tax=Panagrellus redivivus TaxID=6233 RepID=A0A7E4VAZ0_PANRE
MAQHKINQKKPKASATLNKLKSSRSVKKAAAAAAAKKNAPKKGAQIILAPKKTQVVAAAKISATVTRVINERNEEMLRSRADQFTGRNSQKKKE